MIKKQLEDYFTEEGYNKIPSNLPEFTIFFHLENNYVNVFHIIEYRNDLYISEDQYIHIKEKIKQFFGEKEITNVHILSLIVCEDSTKAKKLCREDPFCWMIDPYNNRLIVYENQVNDFYGMRGKLEYWLSHISEMPIEEPKSQPIHINKRKQRPYVTISIVAINIIIFIICTFTGDLLYNKGAFKVLNVLEDNEYYRILSSVFLHWDIDHLFGNMLILYYLGEVVEKYFGRLRYGIIYITAGIFGNLLSMSYELSMGYASLAVKNTQSAGASGAVFGIIGALLLLVLVHKGNLEQITLGRMLFMVAYSLYSGFVGSNINNAAHIGGFLSGVGVAFVLWFIGYLKKNREERKSAS